MVSWARIATCQQRIERGQVTRGDTVRFGGDVTVGRDERIEGDLVSIGGSIELDGEVTGDVVGIGGAVTLGPQAVVRGDLSVVGGSLARAPGARGSSRRWQHCTRTPPNPSDTPCRKRGRF